MQKRIKDVPRFRAAHFGTLAIVGTFACASTAGAVMFVSRFPIPEQFQDGALVLAGIVAASISFMPALMAPAWAESKGFAKAFGLALALVFSSFDALLQTNAVLEFERFSKQGLIDRAQGDLERAQAALDSVPLPDANGAIRRASTWQTVTEPLRVEIREARERVAQAERSSLPVNLILILMSGFQIATFFTRAWLTGITLGQIQEIRDRRSKPRRRRRKSAKP